MDLQKTVLFWEVDSRVANDLTRVLANYGFETSESKTFIKGGIEIEYEKEKGRTRILLNLHENGDRKSVDVYGIGPVFHHIQRYLKSRGISSALRFL